MQGARLAHKSFLTANRDTIRLFQVYWVPRDKNGGFTQDGDDMYHCCKDTLSVGASPFYLRNQNFHTQRRFIRVGIYGISRARAYEERMHVCHYLAV